MIKYRAIHITAIAATITIVLMIVQSTAAQRGPRRNSKRPAAAGGASKKPATLPGDDKMLNLYMEFFQASVKLATKYERENKPEKARQVYTDMRKLFPSYKKAQEKLAEYEAKEATADRKTITISANLPWQDTGIRVIAGKPLRISCEGTWTIKFDHKVDANGMKPAEGQGSFKLGSLVGAIFQSKEKKPQPFAIGGKAELRPSQSGRLLLQMQDVDHADNQGRIRVTIQGTFERI